MNLFRTAILGSLLLAGSVAAPAAAFAGGSQTVAIVQELGASKKALKDCLDQALKDLKATVKLIKAGLKAGTITQAQALIQLSDAAATYSNHLDEHVNYAAAKFLAKANMLLSQNDYKYVTGFLAGDHGAFDKLGQAIAIAMQKYLTKGQAEIGKLGKLIADGGTVKININIQIVIQLPPAAAPGNPLPEADKLKITSAASANDPNIPNDGKLTIHGHATNPGGTATVTAHGPNGETITKTVPVGADGSFQADFPSAPGDGPGNLSEGNWKVDVKADGQTTSKFHGV